MNLSGHQRASVLPCAGSECAYPIAKKGDELLLRSLFSCILHLPGWLRVVLPFQNPGLVFGSNLCYFFSFLFPLFFLEDMSEMPCLGIPTFACLPRSLLFGLVRRRSALFLLSSGVAAEFNMSNTLRKLTR